MSDDKPALLSVAEIDALSAEFVERMAAYWPAFPGALRMARAMAVLTECGTVSMRGYEPRHWVAKLYHNGANGLPADVESVGASPTEAIERAEEAAND